MSTVYRLVRRRRPHDRQPQATQSSIAAHLRDDPYLVRPEPLAFGLGMLR